MPSGKTHDKHWKSFSLTMLATSFVTFVLSEIALVVTNVFPYSQLFGFYLANSFVLMMGDVTGYLMGKYVTPDLDDAGVTKNEWQIMEDIPVLGAAFVGYWMVYGERMTHRGFWSHSYIISSFIRTIYLFAWLILVEDIPQIVYVFIFGIFIGLSKSDAIHIYLDVNFEEKNGKVTKRRDKCRRNSFGNFLSRSRRSGLGKITRRIRRSRMG